MKMKRNMKRWRYLPSTHVPFECQIVLSLNLYSVHAQDWVSILDEEDQNEESDGSLGDWAKLETMRSSHPMYFAKKLTEVTVSIKLCDNHGKMNSEN